MAAKGSAEMLPQLADGIVKAVAQLRSSPSTTGAAVEAEKKHIDGQNILQLPGWERGIRLREGARAYDEAARALRAAKPLHALKRTPALQRAAEGCAQRMAEMQDVNEPHPHGMRLMQAVSLHAKIGGAVLLNLSSGRYTSGESVVTSWAVNDGDTDRDFRRAMLRPEAHHVGVAAAKGADGRVYVAGLFADNCWELQEARNTAAMLVAAYDEDNDGFLSYREFLALCDDLGLDDNLRGENEDDYALMCEDVNKTSDQTAPAGRMTEAGLRRILGGDDAIGMRMRELQQLVSAKRAGRVATQQSSQINKAKAADQVVSGDLAIDRGAVVQRLRELWRQKKGDVVDEMLDNYVTPSDDERDGKQMILAEVARRLKERVGQYYPDRNRVELLNMMLYTMAGPDIDAVMSFTNVPVYNEANPAAWEEYVRLHGQDRNAAMFSSINWAMRMAAGAPKDPIEKSDAWKGVRKWVKTICLLAAICDDSPVKGQVALSRGLAGLPESVVSTHARLAAGSKVDWGAPSSCAKDPHVAESYVKGQAANATKGGGGSVLFRINGATKGIELQDISKYPKEAEVLLSPLSSFKVHFRGSKPDLPGAVYIEMKHESASARDPVEAQLQEFLEECRREAKAAEKKLVKTSEELDSTIPQNLAKVLKPTTREFNHDYFVRQRQLRISRENESCLVGAGVRFRPDGYGSPTSGAAHPRSGVSPQASPTGRTVRTVRRAGV